MDREWAEKLKNFDAVWKRVSSQKAAGSQQAQKIMPGKRNCGANTRFHGGGGRR